MKLFKVTYEKMCNPSKGFYKEEHKGYYFCYSLDRLYNYIENEQHLIVKSIEILDCTVVEQQFKSTKKALNEYAHTQTIIKAQ